MCLRKHMSPVVSLISSSLALAIVLTSLLTLPTPLRSEPFANNDIEALLCLKNHILNSAGLLESWKNDSVIPFCSWSGVTCSKRHSSRVVALDLDSLGLHGQLPPCIANLSFLTRIHFPNNQLSGPIPAELGQINRLQYLNLSSNNLSGIIPNTLSACSLLQIFDLTSNSLSGSIPEGLGTLHNLSVLSLSGNSLTGSIPVSLGSSSSLVCVALTNNSLTGPIPSLLANSSSLQVLSLGNNHLGGEIPLSLFNSTSLQKLVLVMNNFVGSLPVFSNIDSPLQYLILQSNNLAGTIPSTLGNFSSLHHLLLGDNNFHGSIPMSIGKVTNLQVLDMSYNVLSGTVPASLYNMSAITYLGMGMNSLTGELPGNIGYTLPRIISLVMQGNNFQGQIPTSLANTTNLQTLILRSNAIRGIVPSFGTLPNLIRLDLGRNQLEAGDWSFLSSLKNCTKLVYLYLDINNLHGVLPPGSIANLSNSLEVLVLRKNEIFGTIPHEIERLRNLKLLYMEHNFLTGNLPYSVGNLPNLFVLSLSHNKLSGHIPLSLGNLSRLSELYLQENHLSGSIPAALGQSKNLDILNLSCNSFDGGIPKELFSIPILSEGLDLSHNKLSGPIPVEIGGLINLGPLNISNNQLSGEIPSSLGNCIRLESLHMEGNLLDGPIPESFAGLRGIFEMDLSQNNLSGQIPEFFASFSSIDVLNLSFNNLGGPVPTRGIFTNASEVFLQGNKNLCAISSQLKLPLCHTVAKQRHTSHTVKIVGLCALALVSLACLSAIFLRTRKEKKATDPLDRRLEKLSYADLVRATNNFSLINLVGSGKQGSVYVGKIDSNANPVAIKVFTLDQLGAPKGFIAECKALRNTRHRNLVRVITACSTFDPTGQEFKAIVLEYMVNGNLDSWLHPRHGPCLGRPFSLGSRIIIAVDIAAALDYLHNHCMPPMVHCDLKPSNVLLDDVMTARIADFGVSKFLHFYTSSSIDGSTSLVGPRGSVGYIAPEYAFGNKIYTEGDVYSYGIIILEMLTGKRPTDEMFTDGLNLRNFVETALPQKIGEILDPGIMSESDNEEGGDADANISYFFNRNHPMLMLSCIMKLAKLGLSCSAESPRDRPKMKEVYSEVTAIKEEFSALWG